MLSRRILLASLASSAALTHAQGAPQVIGMLTPWKEADAKEAYDVLTQEMLAGYVKSRLNILMRTADSVNSRLPALAEELVKLKVDLIVAATTNAVVAARRASATIPVVFFYVADPVASGLAESLARPGRNNTGLTNYSAGELFTKQLGLLRQVVPNLVRVAFLLNPVSEPADPEKGIRRLGEKFGFRRLVVHASSMEDLNRAFEALGAFQAQVLFVANDAFFGDAQHEIVNLLLRYRLASVWEEEGPVEKGALMSYGVDGKDNYRRVASYADKVLRGEKAGNLPIEQPAKLVFVINRKTAAALGLRISPVVLLQADRVVE